MIKFKEIDLQKYPQYKEQYNIDTIPALFINKSKFTDTRNKENILNFIKNNN